MNPHRDQTPGYFISERCNDSTNNAGSVERLQGISGRRATLSGMLVTLRFEIQDRKKTSSCPR